MKKMKWCICELERLQFQFNHPNPIRNELQQLKLFYVFFFKILILPFLTFNGETLKRCEGFPYDQKQCEECESILVDCIMNCGEDAGCISNCNRDNAECLNDCHHD